MAKAKQLSQLAMDRLKLKYARPKDYDDVIDFSGVDYARRIASSVGAAFDVKVQLSPAPTQVNIDTQVVNLNSKQAYDNGDDYAIGLILHEVGHLKHTPRGVKHRDGWEHELHNLFEDVRMEALVKKEYAGAHYFIDSINKPALEKIAEAAQQLVPVPSEFSGVERNIEKAFYTIIQHAIVRAYGADTSQSFPTELQQWSDAADMLATYMQRSEKAGAEECISLAQTARDLMQPFIARPPKKKPDGTPIPDDKPQHYIKPSQDKVNLLERIEGAQAGGVYQGGYENEPLRYERADSVARMYAANLKRKIIAKLRTNDRTKIVPLQKRGKLNKKMIAKVALNNPRIYQRRLLPKRRSYAASVILDTSGSMWRGVPQARIDLAMQASAMMVRTLRSLGVPTSLSVYGSKASERVAHSDRYLVPETSRDMASLSRTYYRAGHTLTSLALEQQLPKLKRAARGREQLLIIITDGDVGYGEAKRCVDHIRKAQRTGKVHPMIFYVETRSKILNNPTQERELKSAAELPQAAADLLANIQWHE